MKEQEFNEAEYLEANPDVADAVKEGKLQSEHEHYEKYGEREGRMLKRLFGRTLSEEKVFHLLDKTGLDLGFGPSHIKETELQMASNDVGFCLRARKLGYRNTWTPYAELHHHESATRDFEDTPEKQVHFAKKCST